MTQLGNAMYFYGNTSTRRCWCCYCYISVLSDFNSNFSLFKEFSSGFPVSNQRNKNRKENKVKFSRPRKASLFQWGRLKPSWNLQLLKQRCFIVYRSRELLMLFCYLRQWEHYHSRSFEIRWFFSAWNNVRYVIRLINAPSGLAGVRISTPAAICKENLIR